MQILAASFNCKFDIFWPKMYSVLVSGVSVTNTNKKVCMNVYKY